MPCSQVHHTRKDHIQNAQTHYEFLLDLILFGRVKASPTNVMFNIRIGWNFLKGRLLSFNVHPYFGETTIWLICFQMGGSTTKSLSWITKLHAWRLPWRFAPQNGLIYIGHKWCALCFNWAMHFHYGLLLHESWHQCKYQSYWVIYTFYQKN